MRVTKLSRTAGKARVKELQPKRPENKGALTPSGNATGKNQSATNRKVSAPKKKVSEFRHANTKIKRPGQVLAFFVLEQFWIQLRYLSQSL